MANKDYSGLYRGDGPQRSRGSDEESPVEQTLVRPHKLSGTTDGWASAAERSGSTHAAKESRSSSTTERRATTAKHAARSSRRRRTLRRSVGLTLASAVIPGIGLLGARPRWAKLLGVLVPGIFLMTVGLVVWQVVTNLGGLAAIAVDPTSMNAVTVLLIIVAITWAWLVTLTHLLTRPRGMRTARRRVGALLVVALTFGITAPLAVAARYAQDQRHLVDTVFQNDVNSTSHPSINATAKNPWEGIQRLNILLLGADSTATRIQDNNGVYLPRTDTIMVASIDTTTGDTTLVQIPRQVQYTPFPTGSELAKLFPQGFRGDGGEQEWFVNAIWEKTENGDYPAMTQAVGDATYPGAEALKQGVEGITGLPIHYFMLINVDGLQGLIDAMGGVTVNINDDIPIGGDSDAGIKPHGYLKKGPNQKLDGYHAMWFARGRYGYDDFHRMRRQSCLVGAVIKQANPGTLLTSFEAIADSASQMVMTDIPKNVLDPLVQLALKVKDANVTRLQFTEGAYGYSYGSPDFEQMREAVAEATGSGTPVPTPTTQATTAPTESPEPSSEPAPQTTATTEEPTATDPPQEPEVIEDACAYQP